MSKKYDIKRPKREGVPVQHVDVRGGVIQNGTLQRGPAIQISHQQALRECPIALGDHIAWTKHSQPLHFARAEPLPTPDFTTGAFYSTKALNGDVFDLFVPVAEARLRNSEYPRSAEIPVMLMDEEAAAVMARAEDALLRAYDDEADYDREALLYVRDDDE